MNDQISVEASFNKEGKVFLKAFEWRGLHYNVESMGRQWEEDGILHTLVMAVDEQVFELSFTPSTLVWHMVRTPRDFGRRQAV